MYYKVEKNLFDFEFWSGAKVNAEKLTKDEMDRIENMMPDIFVNTPTETEINDLFWFEFETICDWLGLDPEEVENRE